MFIKWLMRSRNWLIGLLMSVFSLPSLAIYKLPLYMDNTECLLRPYNGCYIHKGSMVIDERISLRNYPGLAVTNGTLFVFFPRNGGYAQMLENQIGNPLWAIIEKSGYKFRIGDQSNAGAGTEVPLVATLYLEGLADPNKTDFSLCEGKLQLSNGYYRNHTDINSGLKCKIPNGFRPSYLTVQSGVGGGGIPIYVAMYKPDVRTKKITIPAPQVEIRASGTYTNGQPTPQDSYVIRNLLLAGPVFLNDRICKVSSNTNIQFGNIATTVTAGKVSEKQMPLMVTCAGVRPGCTDNEQYCRPSNASWAGVPNTLVGIKISTSNSFPGGGAAQKIGVKTNDVVREDLYVEGSWSPNKACGVNPLWTDGRTNEQTRTDVPASAPSPSGLPPSSHTVLWPSLYWRLCASPKDGRIQAGQFQGQALISVEYE